VDRPSKEFARFYRWIVAQVQEFFKCGGHGERGGSSVSTLCSPWLCVGIDRRRKFDRTHDRRHHALIMALSERGNLICSVDSGPSKRHVHRPSEWPATSTAHKSRWTWATNSLLLGHPAGNWSFSTLPPVGCCGGGGKRPYRRLAQTVYVLSPVGERESNLFFGITAGWHSLSTSKATSTQTGHQSASDASFKP